MEDTGSNFKMNDDGASRVNTREHEGNQTVPYWKHKFLSNSPSPYDTELGKSLQVSESNLKQQLKEFMEENN